MGDVTGHLAINASSPALHAFLIAPDDDNDLAVYPRGISLAVAGDLKVTMVGGETVVIPSGSLAPGIIHPIRAKKVFDTGTAAQGLVGYY